MDNLSPSESEQGAANSRPAAIDIDLPCPHCDYNLRGLTENRCPECGNHFNRNRLMTWHTGWFVRPTYTRDGEDYTRRALWQACLFCPSRVGKELPPTANWNDAMSHAWTMRFLGLIILALGFGVLTCGVGVAATLIASPVIIVGTLMCERLVAMILARLVKPRFVPEGAEYHFWRNLCYCFSTHFVVTSVLLPVTSMLPLLPGPVLFLRGDLADAAHFAGLTFALAWWWLCLSRAVMVRSVPGPGRAVAILLIPLIGLGSAALMIIAAAIIVGLIAQLLCRGA